jgi:ribosomal-protein-alanine N-acetyltransferase
MPEAYNNSMLEWPLKIRDFHPKDLDTLHDIDLLCFPEGIAFSREELLFISNYPESITRVAEASGRIAGFVMARIESRRQAHIVTLDVVPEVQRQGIGSMLMQDVHNILRAREINASILEVGTGNLGARRLYETLGYRYAGLLSGYYNAGNVHGSSRRSENRNEHKVHSYGAGGGDALQMVRFFD